MSYRVVIGELHENGLSVEFFIHDEADHDGEPMANGFIKWDGCMNWETDKGCMGHFCSPANALAFGEALASVWPLAKPVLGAKADRHYGS